MAEKFKVEVLSPSLKLAEAQATEVIIPGLEGELDILPHHGDYIGAIGSGALKIATGGDDQWFYISGGVWETRAGELSVLVEKGVKSNTLNPEKIKADVAAAKLENNTQKAKEFEIMLDVYKRANLIS